MDGTERMSAGVELGENRYGKAQVKLVKVLRGAGGATRCLTGRCGCCCGGVRADVYGRGQLADCGDGHDEEHGVLAGAAKSGARTAEAFGAELVEFLLGRNAQVSGVEVEIESALWKRLTVEGKAHHDGVYEGERRAWRRRGWSGRGWGGCG